MPERAKRASHIESASDRNLHPPSVETLSAVSLWEVVKPTCCILVASYRAYLGGDKRRTRPLVIGILGQQMPAEHGEFARHGDRSDLVTTPGSDTQEQRTQRAWRLGGSLGRFGRHGAGMAATALADVGCKGNY